MTLTHAALTRALVAGSRSERTNPFYRPPRRSSISSAFSQYEWPVPLLGNGIPTTHLSVLPFSPRIGLASWPSSEASGSWSHSSSAASLCGRFWLRKPFRSRARAPRPFCARECDAAPLALAQPPLCWAPVTTRFMKPFVVSPLSGGLLPRSPQDLHRVFHDLRWSFAQVLRWVSGPTLSRTVPSWPHRAGL